MYILFETNVSTSSLPSKFPKVLFFTSSSSVFIFFTNHLHLHIYRSISTPVLHLPQHLYTPPQHLSPLFPNFLSPHDTNLSLHTCIHISTPFLHLSPALSTPACISIIIYTFLYHPHTCLSLSTPVYTSSTPVHTCFRLSRHPCRAVFFL